MLVGFDRGEVMRCIREQGYREVREVLGAGSFGVAYVICEKTPFTIGVLIKVAADVARKDCKMVVKIVRITPDNQASIERELYIYRQLGKTGNNIAPKLDKAWQCNGAQYLALQRFSGDMESLGRQQLAAKRPQVSAAILAKATTTNKNKSNKVILDEVVRRFTGAKIRSEERGETNLLYTDAQIKQMFQVAYELGRQYHIIHGDVKPDNFLYDDNTGQIVIADFGQSGYYNPKDKKRTKLAEVGWPWWLTKGCNEERDVIRPPQKHLGEYNAWQLAAFLGANEQATYVVQPDGSIALFRINYRGGRRVWKQFEGKCDSEIEARIAASAQQLIDAYIHLPAYYPPLVSTRRGRPRKR